ncbi:MAG TPA: hypothetical protein VJR47_03335, partial [Stellaceae bacterium]|nr:hypothetical protein [Stellaceae bacterium]
MTGDSQGVVVNGVAVDSARFPSPAVAAVRELLRQRAVAAGLLDATAGDEGVASAIEQLLDRE